MNNACVSVRALEQSGVAAGLDVDVRYTHAEDLICEVQDLSTFFARNILESDTVDRAGERVSIR